MAHRLLWRRMLESRSKATEVRQQFNYLLVLDFEATCDKNIILTPQEIIEFPCFALSTNDWEVKDIFHKYVKPRVNPILTPFCTDLTGIMQQHVDESPHFPEVFAEFNKWLADGGFIDTENTSAFITCGDWDLKVLLPKQCALEDIEVPQHCRQWIDLKKSYCDATDYYPRSLTDMLVRSNLPLRGRLHSGYCDVQNMTQIITYLKEHHKAIFNITSLMKVKIKGFAV